MSSSYHTKYAEQIELNRKFERFIKNIHTVYSGPNTIEAQLPDHARHHKNSHFHEYCDAGIDEDEACQKLSAELT